MTRSVTVARVRHSFQVDLRGVVDLLSHHLYSSPDVYVRELLQNAVDAITARGVPGSVVVECLTGRDGVPVVSVEDDGVGLTVAEVHELLSTIGASSKRDELLAPRTDFLGRFGIGLLSCFLVSDEIRVVTLSARGGPGVSWQGRGDGTYDLRELPAGEGRSTPGTSLWLKARPGSAEQLSPARVRELILRYGGLLAQPILLRTPDTEEVLAGRPLPWTGQDRAALLAYGERELGETFLDAVPLDLPAAGLTGVAFVLGQSPSPAARQRHRVHLKRMLLSDTVDGLLPGWAFFARVVVDVGALRPLASREGLYEDEALHAVREGLGSILRSWLVGLAERDPARLQTMVRVHGLALKALAVHDDELLRLFAPWLPVETTLGRMTLTEVAARDRVVRYTPTTDSFRQLAQVATAEGICLVNAGYTYDTELLLRLPEVLTGVEVERADAEDLAAVLRPVDLDDRAGAEALAARCRPVLDPYDCDVEVRSFAPASLPCLYTAGEGARFHREAGAAAEVAGGFWGPLLSRMETAYDREPQARLALNFRHPVVRRLAGAVPDETLRTAVEVLYLQALLLGHHPLRGRETSLIGRALGRLVETSVGA